MDGAGHEGLAIEDSVVGVRAAVAAGFPVVGRLFSARSLVGTQLE